MTGLDGMNLNLLVALGALLETRNLTRAGERIGTSQPAMSGSLERLRRHYGDDLLVRVGREYELSPLAEKLQPFVQEALRQVAQTLEASHRFEPATCQREFSLVISDYAVTVLIEPLLTLLRAQAPSASVKVHPIPTNSAEIEPCLLRNDLYISAFGFGIPGRRQMVFQDRFVCIADRGNPRLRNGSFTIDDIRELPHARASFHTASGTPAERLMDELRIERHAEVICHGLLPLPFVVSGTNLIAFVPERLARRCVGPLGLAIAETPFESAELVEGAHWHPSRTADPALRWLLSVLREVADLV